MHRGALFTGYLTFALGASALGAPYVPFAPAATLPVFVIVCAVMTVAMAGARPSRAIAGVAGVVLWSIVWMAAEMKMSLDRGFDETAVAPDLVSFRVVMAALIGGAAAMLVIAALPRRRNKDAPPRVVARCTAARCSRRT